MNVQLTVYYQSDANQIKYFLANLSFIPNIGDYLNIKHAVYHTHNADPENFCVETHETELINVKIQGRIIHYNAQTGETTVQLQGSLP